MFINTRSKKIKYSKKQETIVYFKHHITLSHSQKHTTISNNLFPAKDLITEITN